MRLAVTRPVHSRALAMPAGQAPACLAAQRTNARFRRTIVRHMPLVWTRLARSHVFAASGGLATALRAIITMSAA